MNEKSRSRSAARLAAVQALYQREMENTPLAQLLHEFHLHRLGATIEDATYADAEVDFFDDVVKVYDEAYREKLERLIDKVSEIHAVDVNLYDLDGNLRVSSLPLPYNKGIISTRMDPVAYYHLNKQKEVQYFKEEKIGKLSFVSNYVPVIDGNGREYAYLNIPYFTSESKLQEEIANFLVTIINLNAFIFLIAGIVALFITNRITRSFSFISKKMKAVSLGQMNEAIDWKRDDEIGELVKEYNKMVAKLDESAVALAKSEREGAWREMARQVAHEIKNPLTPMKLSLQYLQKAISNNADNVRELTANVALTLVEQIDHLTHIAGEFSQFANIGNPHNEDFELNEVLRMVTQLHSINDRLQLSWNSIACSSGSTTTGHTSAVRLSSHAGFGWQQHKQWGCQPPWSVPRPNVQGHRGGFGTGLWATWPVPTYQRQTATD